MSQHLVTIDNLRITEFTGPARLQHRVCLAIESVGGVAELTLPEVRQLYMTLDAWLETRRWIGNESEDT